MTRNLKALGLAFVAVFAMSAIAASAAQATEFFHQEKEKAIVTASNEGSGMTGAHVFELVTNNVNLKVECTSAKFEGTEKNASLKSESLTVTPTYSGCTALGGFLAEVDTTKEHECHYKLFAATTETVAGKAHGNVEVICTGAIKSIDITVPALGVVLHVPNQLVPHAVNYANVNTEGGASHEEVTINTTAEMNIAWTCTPKATCLAGLGIAEGKEATYKGLATAKGFIDEKETPTGEYVEGGRQGISKGP